MTEAEDIQITCHALRDLERGQDPWDAPMVVCQDPQVTRAINQDLPMPQGHDITVMPSDVTCPECIRRRRAMTYSGGGWAPLRHPLVDQATSAELNDWAQWTAGFIDTIAQRAQELQQSPGCPGIPAGTENLSTAAATLREWSRQNDDLPGSANGPAQDSEHVPASPLEKNKK